MRFVTSFLKNQQGQALVDYAYMLLCIALVAIAGFSMLGFNVLDLLSSFPWVST